MHSALSVFVIKNDSSHIKKKKCHNSELCPNVVYFQKGETVKAESIEKDKKRKR